MDRDFKKQLLFIFSFNEEWIMRRKRKLSFLVRLIIFIIIAGFMLQKASLIVHVWGTEQGDPDRRSRLFFTLPKDSVDCLFVGTSHIYCSFIPQQIYEKTGLRSASIATSSQSYQNSYWLLKEALKKQHPKYVIMDIHSVTTPADENVKNFRLHYTSGVSILPDLSINKILAYLDIKYHNEDWVENMTVYDAYGFLEYRNDYERVQYSLKELAHLLTDPKKEFTTLGFHPSTEIYPIEELVPGYSSDKYIDFYQTQEYEYLAKIQTLLEENEIQMILVRAPYTMPDFDDMHLSEQAIAWAENENIPFIDFFLLTDELGIDLAADFKDSDHLNQNGAQKVTTYLAQYLTEREKLYAKDN